MKSADLNSLFDEQSLFAIWRKAPSFFSNNFNVMAAGATLFGLGAVSAWDYYLQYQAGGPFLPLAAVFNTWAALGVSLAGTILGFLIAGFAVLCTVLRPQTMIALQKMENERYGETELKVLFVLFVDVLVQFLALLSWSLLASVFTGPSVPIVNHLLSTFAWWAPGAVAHVLFVCWGTWLVSLSLTLKSFIFNLYQSLLLGLADTLDDYEREKLTVVCPVQPSGPEPKARTELESRFRN